MTSLFEKMIPGFTYHIVPGVARNKSSITELLKPIIDDPDWGAVQFPPLLDPEVAKEFGHALQIAGMVSVYGVGQSLARASLDLHSLDENVRLASVEKTKRYIDEAYLIGARIMDLNPGKDPGAENRGKAKTAAVESLTRLCEYAQEKAADYVLALSIENFDRDVDKKFYLGPTSETIEVVSAVRKSVPNMGLTPDVAHLLIMGENPCDSVIAAGDMIFHAHLANYIIKDTEDPRWGDNHPPFWVDGSEVYAAQLAGYLKGLAEIGYFDSKPDEFRQRVVTFEIRPGAGEPTPTVMAGSMRILKKAVAAIED